MNILITGANRGLGYALSLEALKRGHTIVAGVRDAQTLSESLRELVKRYPGHITIAELDMTDEASIAEASARLKAQGQTVDAIVNNAGILLARDSGIDSLDFEDMRNTMEINLYGPMRVVKHMLPLMPSGSTGAIINISSEAGSISNAYGGDYPYAISKAALNMFSQQLSRLLKDRDTRVYAVHPGWIRTDMGGSAAPGDPAESARGITDLLERKTSYEGPYVFIDFSGKPMSI